MSRSNCKLANYAQVAARDRQALQLAEQTGCSVSEAWARILDAEEAGQTYEHLREQMAADGLPFLDGAELDAEIAERKGSRF